MGRPLEDISEDDWHAIFRVNVDGAFYFSQAAAPLMKARGSGRIVNISSGAGLGVSLTGIQAYASAKAAQIGLTRQLAHELGPFGITVNNVAPGFVRSNPTTERQWGSYGEEGQRRLVEGIALKKLGTPDDIAHAVLFFASEYAGWITGQVLSVDGGSDGGRSGVPRRAEGREPRGPSRLRLHPQREHRSRAAGGREARG